MVGIDIIDLRDPLLKKRTARDLRLISHKKDAYPPGWPSDRLFWVLWTAKEAVFKTFRTLTRFEPRKIPILLFESNDLLFFKSKEHVSGQVSVGKHFVGSVALAHNHRIPIDYRYFEITKTDQSGQVREHLRTHGRISHSATLSHDDKKLPFLLKKNKLYGQVSFSHHHHMGAFAYYLLK